MKGMQGDALFSLCGKYRYELVRTWSTQSPRVAFIMLNPSTATATANDPTVRRCIGYAMRWGYGGLLVGNLFALRSTDPAALLTDPDPIGPANDEALRYLARSSALVVAAWGAHRAVTAREGVMPALLGDMIMCLGVTKGNHPRHPLYLKSDTPLTRWIAQEERHRSPPLA